MDINPSYNCLLGKPWIHIAGAVPSILHQKIKFVVEESLITVVVEENMIATMTVTALYLELKEDTTECSFRSFKVAITTNTKSESKTLMLHLSQNIRMIGSLIGFQLEDQRKNGRMGSQKKNRMVRSNLIFPPLNWTFISGGYINSDLPGKMKT